MLNVAAAAELPRDGVGGAVAANGDGECGEKSVEAGERPTPGIAMYDGG